MFKNKKVVKEQVSNTIEIKNMEHLKMLISSVAKTAQMDFGLSWDVVTAQEDDERAFALAVASIHEMGARIISHDKAVIEFINEVVNKQINKHYLKEEK